MNNCDYFMFSYVDSLGTTIIYFIEDTPDNRDYFTELAKVITSSTTSDKLSSAYVEQFMKTKIANTLVFIFTGKQKKPHPCFGKVYTQTHKLTYCYRCYHTLDDKYGCRMTDLTDNLLTSGFTEQKHQCSWWKKI